MKLIAGILAFLCLFSAVSLISASSYSIEFNQVGDKIVVKESIDNLQISSYVDSDILDRGGNELYFVRRIKFNESYDSAEITLNLEKGVVLEKEKAYPAGYSIETDGQRISLIWSLENVKKEQIFAVFATLEDTKITSKWIYWVSGAGLVFIVLLAVFFFYRRPKKTENKKPAKAKIVKSEPEARYDYLLETEKKVIEELKKADRNELWQKQIQNSTGFSKAKVSRLVRNLEARGLIVKIPFGNTNKLRLK